MSKSEWNLDWNDDEKVAAIYYCYLSLDKIDNEEKSGLFSVLLFDGIANLESYLCNLGLRMPLNVPYNNLDYDTFVKIEDEIPRYCDEVIATFDENERYESIVEELDRLFMDYNSGDHYFNSRNFLWVFVLLSVNEDILTVGRRKYLNHLCSVAGIDKSVLLEMEEVAKSFIAIGKKRIEIKIPNAERWDGVDLTLEILNMWENKSPTPPGLIAVLDILDAEEQALHKKVNTLLKAK